MISYKQSVRLSKSAAKYAGSGDNAVFGYLEYLEDGGWIDVNTHMMIKRYVLSYSSVKDASYYDSRIADFAVEHKEYLVNAIKKARSKK